MDIHIKIYIHTSKKHTHTHTHATKNVYICIYTDGYTHCESPQISSDLFKDRVT